MPGAAGQNVGPRRDWRLLSALRLLEDLRTEPQVGPSPSCYAEGATSSPFTPRVKKQWLGSSYILELHQVMPGTSVLRRVVGSSPTPASPLRETVLLCGPAGANSPSTALLPLGDSKDGHNFPFSLLCLPAEKRKQVSRSPRGLA